MSYMLRQYLFDAYESRQDSFARKINNTTAIQIDDQDDSDKINEFCNIFCIVLKNDSFIIEFSGNFPITQEMSDLVEIYNGKVNPLQGTMTITLNIDQIEVLMDLADKIRKTSFSGIETNPAWLTMSSRTISSLYRFVRIIKEFKNSMSNTQSKKLATLHNVFKSFLA